MKDFIASLRVTAATMLVCVAGYTLVVLAVAQLFAGDSAAGSLVRRPDGEIVGSRLIAQEFEQPGYFWPRPSAPDYNASGAAGSNKSPTSTALTERAAGLVERYGASAAKPLPAELAAASGGGLDPHITRQGALYQAERIAGARGLTSAEVEALVNAHAFSPGGFLTTERLVNVLELNLALDERSVSGPSPR